MTILVYGKSIPPCKFCKLAVEVLDNRGVDYEFVDLSLNPELLELSKMHHQTIPQIYEDGVHKGGSDAANYVGHVQKDYGNPLDWEWTDEVTPT